MVRSSATRSSSGSRSRMNGIVLHRIDAGSVINETASTKWYAAGLHFGCEVCGRCCAGPGEGYIWVTKPEIELIAAAPEPHAGGAAVPIPAAGGTADHDRRAQPHQGLHLPAVGWGHEAVRDLRGPAGPVPHVGRSGRRTCPVPTRGTGPPCGARASIAAGSTPAKTSRESERIGHGGRTRKTTPAPPRGSGDLRLDRCADAGRSPPAPGSARRAAACCDFPAYDHRLYRHAARAGVPGREARRARAQGR